MATTPYPFVANAVLTASQLNSTFNIPVSTKTASYTLVAADGGTRIVMNSGATNTTITVNTALFSAGDSVWIQNISTSGTCTITAGTATVTTATSLVLPRWGGGTLYFTSTGASIFFSGSPVYGAASGGTGALATPPTGYAGSYFNSSLTLTVSRAGVFDVLAFGGGGGGGLGNGVNACGGGGGAGQYTQTSIYLAVGSYNVIIGGGGAGAVVNPGTLGSGVTIGNTIGNFAVAGGGGGSSGGTGQTGTVGGSGGGGGGGASANVGGASFGVATGFAGGTGATTLSAGGGGGAGAVGANSAATTGAAGGAGFNIATFTGNASTFKAGGGGGGGSTAGGAGGSSVGGAGGTATGTAAAANTASGGGGSNNGNGAAGGSGVLYIRWKV